MTTVMDGRCRLGERKRPIAQSVPTAAPRLQKMAAVPGPLPGPCFGARADERVYDNYSDMTGAYSRTVCIHHHIMLTLDLRHYGQH